VKFACVDGPDFDGHRVDFKNCSCASAASKGRNRSERDYAHICNVEKVLFETEQGATTRSTRTSRRTAVKMPGAMRSSVRATQGSESWRLQHARCAEGRALHHVHKPDCHRRLPGVDRHSRASSPPAACADVDGALGVINESNLFPRYAAASARRNRQCEPQCVVGRNKKVAMEPVAIGRLERFIRRQRARAQARAAAASNANWAGRRRRLRALGPRRRRDLVRYACDVTVFEALHVVGGVPVRHPAVRCRATSSARGRKPEGHGRPVRDQQVIGKTFSIAQLMGGWATTRCSSAPARARPFSASRANLPARSIRRTNS